MNKKYRENNKKTLLEWSSRYTKKRLKTDPNFRVKRYLRTHLWVAFKQYTKTGKIWSASKYGINYKKIIEYLKPFPENLSLYHIDHIRPLCSFNFVNEDGSTNLEEIKIAFAPENHQWLTIQENLSKGGRY